MSLDQTLNQKIDITVAIRTYNGANKIPAILDQLKIQANTQNINWEIVIVDNNSNDNTAEIIHHYQTHWTQPTQIRYIFEPQPGAAIARRRAIQEAKGELIAFLDDDNTPFPDWVSAAYTFAQAHPKAAAFGSRILPKYEIDPPDPSFHTIAHYLPTRESTTEYQYDSYKRGLPVGAGLVIRRQPWLDHATHQIIQGPVGKGFAFKGEETEALSQIKLANWEIWYNPAMTILHHIPKERLDRPYLLNFFRTIGLSQHRFRMLRFQPWQRPLIFPILLLNDLQKIARHTLQHRKTFPTNIANACQLQFLIGRLLSPFYIWFHIWKAR